MKIWCKKYEYLIMSFYTDDEVEFSRIHPWEECSKCPFLCDLPPHVRNLPVRALSTYVEWMAGSPADEILYDYGINILEHTTLNEKTLQHARLIYSLPHELEEFYWNIVFKIKDSRLDKTFVGGIISKVIELLVELAITAYPNYNKELPYWNNPDLVHYGQSGDQLLQLQAALIKELGEVNVTETVEQG
jgi:hypothetical protein